MDQPKEDITGAGPSEGQTIGLDAMQEAADRGPRLREIPRRLLIPNLITVLAICAGLTAVRLGYEGKFEMAVLMILLAAFLDGVDGRAARLLKAHTNFGAQLDSLADMVNFGVVPALVLHAYVLNLAPSFGWVAALLYAIANALRLARFNVMLERDTRQDWEDSYFIGVPAPLGALLALLPLYLGFLGVEMNAVIGYFASFYMIMIAFLLVSRVPVFSGKSVGQSVKREWFLPLILVAVLYVWLAISFTWLTMTITALLYLLSLPFGAYAWSKKYGARSMHLDEYASLDKRRKKSR